MARSWPQDSSKSSPRRLSTSAPSTAGAYATGPPRISRSRSRTERDAVGPFDAGVSQPRHGHGSPPGVLREPVAELDRVVGGRVGDADDPTRRVAVEHRLVFGDGDPTGRVGDGGEVGRGEPAVDGV